MIDGGPRHYILDQINIFYEENPQIKIIVAVFDAHKLEYANVFNHYATSNYFKGSIELIDGTKFYEKKLEKESWIAHLD
jgi:hypothetical protein